MRAALFSMTVLIAAYSTPVLAQKGGVAFLEPKDGTTVSSPFKVRLDVKGMTAAPAGESKAGTGHHHVLINSDGLGKGDEIPFTKRNLHLSQGQSEIMVTLAPGTYKLTAQFGDGTHKSLGPEYALTITVTVK